MLEKFKLLDKNGQYEVIVQEIKKIEFNSIVIRQLLNDKTNEKIIEKLDDFYKSIYLTKTLIHISQLSDNFKKILVDDVNDKLLVFDKEKTR